MVNENDNVVDANEIFDGAEIVGATDPGVDVVDAGELPEEPGNGVDESPQEQASLGVNDLHLMAMIIDIVSQRGAIRANEMENVGTLYNKLVNFLVANGIIKDPNAPIPAPENADTQIKGEENA
jgi:hypothetical protein